MAELVLLFLSGDAMKVNDLYPFPPSSSSSYCCYSTTFKMLRGNLSLAKLWVFISGIAFRNFIGMERGSFSERKLE